MELLILCAGAGEKSWQGDERDRPLRTRGKRQAQKIGALLGRKGARPDRVLTDGCLRSRVTVEKALKAAGWTARDIGEAPELAAATMPDLSGSLRPLLVVLPGSARALARTLGLSTCSDGDLRDAFGPGVLVGLSLAGETCRHTARTDPQDLDDLFPFPAPDGAERRERPAYYYRQSAVIPFRQTASGPEILIVGSSGGRHWTLPKGIVEPGLSPAASARIEAREEAGVEGRVARAPLGSFTYEKWGAPCDVTVFAMEVTKLIEDGTWEESHRTRRWVSQEEAANLLKQPGYGEMVAKI